MTPGADAGDAAHEPGRPGWFGTGGARLTEDPVVEYHRSEPLRGRLEAVHRFDLAHAVMLTEKGLIPQAAGRAILRGLRAMEAEGVEEARLTAGGGLHSAERYLAGAVGEEVSGWLHLGRSSGDLGAVSLRIAMRERLIALLERVGAARAAVITVAARELDTVMPGYTHGQQAQPMTVAHWLAMWGCVLERDSARLMALLGRLDASPAGAGALTGTDFPLDRERTAQLLGFARPAANALDAVHSHDLDLECLSALAILGENLARLAEDILKWSGDEFGLLTLADRYCVTSSILPHKRNPQAPQAMKGVAAVAVGALVAGLYVNKAPTSEAILDQGTGVQPALWRTLELLTARLGELPDLLETLQFDRARMAELAAGSWGQAVDIAATLVREQGLPWRTAHQISATLVRRCAAAGIAPEQVTVELLSEAAAEYTGEPVALSPQALAEASDPRASVARRTLTGGPAPAAAKDTLDGLERGLAADRDRLAELTDRLGRARRELDQAVDAILAADRASAGEPAATSPADSRTSPAPAVRPATRSRR